MDERQQVVRRLLKVAGTTYAAEVGVRISDRPMPLFQLLGALAPRANARLAAASVRASLDDDVRQQVC